MDITVIACSLQMDINRPELYNVGKTANIYYSVKNKVKFEYSRGSQGSSDKEFTIVATAFKKSSEWTWASRVGRGREKGWSVLVSKY